jgi:endonuclease YncB( thermonuclease family)
VTGLALAGLSTVPASAGTVSGTTTTQGATDYGTVTFVADGDTADVKIDGVAADSGRTGTRIRFVGLQAMEQHTYKIDLSLATGECHSLQATAELRSILGGARNDYAHRQTNGSRVLLTARDLTSSSRDRELRMVSVRDTDGTWDDVAITMLRDGMALPFFNRTEYTHNRQYRLAAQEAAAARRGLWNPDSCGTRPEPSADLSVSVHWDAPGNDAEHVNGEYFRITNNGTATVSLTGWWVRDSSLRDFFYFPASAKLTPGQKAFVHVGKGSPFVSAAGNRHYYWGQSSPAFENVTGAPTWMGDGGYLFDTVGNLRAYQLYGLT